MSSLKKKGLQNNAVDESKIRLSNDGALKARNVADDGDIELLKVNASDEIEVPNLVKFSGGNFVPVSDDSVRLGNHTSRFDRLYLSDRMRSNILESNIGQTNQAPFIPTNGNLTQVREGFVYDGFSGSGLKFTTRSVKTDNTTGNMLFQVQGAGNGTVATGTINVNQSNPGSDSVSITVPAALFNEFYGSGGVNTTLTYTPSGGDAATVASNLVDAINNDESLYRLDFFYAELNFNDVIIHSLHASAESNNITLSTTNASVFTVPTNLTGGAYPTAPGSSTHGSFVFEGVNIGSNGGNFSIQNLNGIDFGDIPITNMNWDEKVNEGTFGIKSLAETEEVSFSLIGLTGDRTITVPDADVDLGQIATNTGNIATNSGDISTLQTNVANKVDKAGDTMDSGANLTFQGGGEVLGLPSVPTAAGAAASKAYVDATRVAGRTIGNLEIATTSNITLSGEQTLQTVSLTAGDLVLVAGQTDQTENGAYEVQTGAWTRIADLDNSPNGEVFNGILTARILQGDHAGKQYIITSVGTGTDGVHQIGVDNIVWSELSAPTQLNAGDGIDSTQFSSNIVQVEASALTGTGIEADGSNNFRLATQGNGIAGGNGSLLSVQPDTTSADANKAKAVVVGSEGVSVAVDNATIKENTTNQLAAPKVVWETYELDSADITAEYFDLNNTATDANLFVAVLGGVAQERGVDFTVGLTAGASGVTRIYFGDADPAGPTSSPLDPDSGQPESLAAGSKLIVGYAHFSL